MKIIDTNPGMAKISDLKPGDIFRTVDPSRNYWINYHLLIERTDCYIESWDLSLNNRHYLYRDYCHEVVYVYDAVLTLTAKLA